MCRNAVAKMEAQPSRYFPAVVLFPRQLGPVQSADAIVKRNSGFPDIGIPCCKSFFNQTSRDNSPVHLEVSIESRHITETKKSELFRDPNTEETTFQ
jgi:hypothetical protein